MDVLSSSCTLWHRLCVCVFKSMSLSQLCESRLYTNHGGISAALAWCPLCRPTQAWSGLCSLLQPSHQHLGFAQHPNWMIWGTWTIPEEPSIRGPALTDPQDSTPQIPHLLAKMLVFSKAPVCTRRCILTAGWSSHHLGPQGSLVVDAKGIRGKNAGSTFLRVCPSPSLLQAAAVKMFFSWENCQARRSLPQALCNTKFSQLHSFPPVTSPRGHTMSHCSSCFLLPPMV